MPTVPSAAMRLSLDGVTFGAPGVKLDVPAFGTLVCKLDSIAGVDSVSFVVSTTDETTLPGDFPLVVSGVKGEIVTIAAVGDVGTAGIIQATINAGVDPTTGNVDLTKTRRTIKWFVNVDGLEVGAYAEGNESDPTFGSTGILNGAIRVIGSFGAITNATVAPTPDKVLLRGAGGQGYCTYFAPAATGTANDGRFRVADTDTQPTVAQGSGANAFSMLRPDGAGGLEVGDDGAPGGSIVLRTNSTTLRVLDTAANTETFAVDAVGSQIRVAFDITGLPAPAGGTSATRKSYVDAADALSAAILAAATKNATPNVIAKRGASAECSFGPLDSTTLLTSDLASLDSLEVANAALFDSGAQMDGPLVVTASMNDGSTPLPTGAFINLPATSTTVSYRNAADSGNVIGLSIDGADNVSVGSGALTVQLAAPVEHRHAALGVTEVAGVSLINATAATSGNQQYSPAVVLEGRGWTTNAGGSSNVSRWWAQTRPVQSSGAAVQTRLTFSYATGVGAPTDLVRFDSVVGLYVASAGAVVTNTIDADGADLKIGTNTAAGVSATGKVVAGAVATPVQFSGQRYSPYFTLTYGATTTIDWANGDRQNITLTGDVTFAAPSNIKDGATYVLVIVQDGAGAHTASWNAAFKFIGAGTDQTLSSGAGAVDIFVFEAIGSALLCTVARKALA